MELSVNVVVIEKRDVCVQSKKGLYATRTTKIWLSDAGSDGRRWNTDISIPTA